MIIEETVNITASLDRVWEVFMNLTCWADWNSILTDVSSSESCLIEGGKFSCCIRPYAFSIYFQPKVVEVIPKKKIVWTGKKYWITSLHEFSFDETPEGSLVRSREIFSGLPITFGGFFFPQQKIRDLNISFLADLKRATEAAL